MGNSIPDPLSPATGIRNSAMAIPAFRKLWNCWKLFLALYRNGIN
jgi:hypothetical protein